MPTLNNNTYHKIIRYSQYNERGTKYQILSRQRNKHRCGVLLSANLYRLVIARGYYGHTRLHPNDLRAITAYQSVLMSRSLYSRRPVTHVVLYSGHCSIPSRGGPWPADTTRAAAAAAAASNTDRFDRALTGQHNDRPTTVNAAAATADDDRQLSHRPGAYSAAGHTAVRSRAGSGRAVLCRGELCSEQRRKQGSASAIYSRLAVFG